MTETTTIPTDEARDMALPSPVAQLGNMPSALGGMPTPQLLPLESKKRDKTWGEVRFNLETYAGVAMLGNEVASLAIAQTTEKAGWAQTHYAKFEQLFANMAGKVPESLAGKSRLRDYFVGNETLVENGKKLRPALPALLLATVGGMLMVPFVKYLEDNKGSIVRRYDAKHYGARNETDPELIAAHKEMDEAPKQSWSSLWKGRGTTVVAAAIADFTFGWKYALTTEVFGKKFSLDGLAEKVAKPFPEKYQGVAKYGTWLLLLSSALTALFYVSSKLFAKNRDVKIEQKYEKLHTPRAYGDVSEEPEVAPAQAPEMAAQPAATVHSVEHQQKLETNRELTPA